MRVSAATSWLLTPRMSMALIGVSRACSPRRRALASSREVAIAAPRLHQVSPNPVDRTVATRTPDSTAPTRTAPILIVENAEACTTSSAVRGPVRSSAPSVSTSEIRYDTTAAAVSRATVTSVGRSRPGTSRHRAGWLGQARSATRCHREGPVCGVGVICPFWWPADRSRRPRSTVCVVPRGTSCRGHGGTGRKPRPVSDKATRAPVPSGWRCRLRQRCRSRSGPSPPPGRVGRCSCAPPAPSRPGARRG